MSDGAASAADGSLSPAPATGLARGARRLEHAALIFALLAAAFLPLADTLGRPFGLHVPAGADYLQQIVLWLAFCRPRDAATALATLAVSVAAGVIVFGPDLWLEWLATFREPLERTFTANIAFSGLLGPAGVGVGVVAALVVGAAALARRSNIGLGLSLVAGVILGPYTFIHYLAGLVVLVDPVLRARPRWLAPYPWLLVVFPLIPVWLLALAWTTWRSPSPDSSPSPPSPVGAAEAAPP